MLERLKENGYKFVIDSRRVKKGDIFIALKGEKTDGHLFVNEAFDKGAEIAIVEKEGNYKGDVIKVDNVIDFLNRETSKVLKAEERVAITGSVGKTTTKDFLYWLLQPFSSVFKTPENYNTEIGIPLSILNEYSNEKIAILEMGLRKPNDLKYLVEHYKPNVVIITKIGTPHLEFFKNRREIIKEKLKILSEGVEKAIIYYDEEVLRILENQNYDIKKLITYGTEKSPVYLEDFEYTLNGFTKAVYHFYSEKILLTFSGYWTFGQLNNLSSVFIYVTEKGFPLLPDKVLIFQKPSSRFQVFQIKSNIIIDDTYNASREAFLDSINSVKKMPFENMKKILIMGEILEVGEFSEDFHKEVFEKAREVFDDIIIFDPLNRLDYLNAKKVREEGEVIELLNNFENSIVLLKASHSTGLNFILTKYLAKHREI